MMRELVDGFAIEPGWTDEFEHAPQESRHRVTPCRRASTRIMAADVRSHDFCPADSRRRPAGVSV